MNKFLSLAMTSEALVRKMQNIFDLLTFKALIIAAVDNILSFVVVFIIHRKILTFRVNRLLSIQGKCQVLFSLENNSRLWFCLALKGLMEIHSVCSNRVQRKCTKSCAVSPK